MHACYHEANARGEGDFSVFSTIPLEDIVSKRTLTRCGLSIQQAEELSARSNRKYTDCMDETTLSQKILELVNGDNYQPVKPKQITKKLGLSKDDVKSVRRVIKRMARQGLLAWGGGHLVRKAGEGPGNQIVGVFRRISSGAGFVRPRGVGSVSDRSQDIHIPGKYTKDASSGDVVLVHLRKGAAGANKRTGEIVEILERDTHQFVGVYFESQGGAFVQIDGNVFKKPVPVGDPGAKSASESDKVVIEMVRFPTHWHDGEGVIVKVLGKRGEPGVDTLSIIHEFNLPGDFPEDVLENSREIAEQFDESIGDRTDLTETTIITIDPVDARDFDDAISLERIDNRHWRLGVHIADVSHFVPKGSPLDGEGRNRATSVYLPDMVIPMLPEIISNNLASLQPNRVRYTKTVFIEFTPDGARVGCEPHAAAIKSCRRFTYEEVDDYLANPKAWEEKLTPEVHSLLGRMHELAMILRHRRFERGALELSMRDVEIELDRQGKVSGAHLAEHTESHQIIEEFMLAANEAVAEMLDDRELFFLRRIHGAPDPKKLRNLADFLREFDIECGSLEDRFEVQRILAEVHGEPYERSVNFAVLKSMQKAVYGPEEMGHYALASEHYCHFTSPIRRYPDLTVHRLLDDIIAGRKPVNEYEPLVVLGEHCSDREQRAEKAERELTKVKLLGYMAERIGQQFEAVITGVQDFGLFAQALKVPAEGLIHVSSLSDDYYEYDSQIHSLVGNRVGNQYRLGDLVVVEAVHVDIDRRELDYRLIRKLKSAPGKKKTKKKSSKRKSSSRKTSTGSGEKSKASSRSSSRKKSTTTKGKRKPATSKRKTSDRKTNQAKVKKKRGKRS